MRWAKLISRKKKLVGIFEERKSGKEWKNMFYIIATATLVFTIYVAGLLREQQEQTLIPIKVSDRPLNHRR